MMFLVFLLGFYIGGLLMCAIGAKYYWVALRNDDDHVSKKSLIIAILVWPVSTFLQLHYMNIENERRPKSRKTEY